MGNACYYSVEKLLSSSLLSKNLKVRIYKTVILPVVLYGCETWTLTLREKHRLRVLENKVVMKIFGAKRDEVTGEWRKLHDTELHALYSSPDIIRNIKSRRLRWGGHVARMGESRNAYRVLVGRPEGKTPFGRPRRRWEDNIKMDLREVGYDDREWINLAQDRDQWRAYVRAAMNLRRLDEGETISGIPRCTIHDWKRNRATLEEYCASTSSNDKRRTLKQPSVFKYDKDLFLWFREQRRKGTPISGPILKEKVLDILKKHGGDNFSASDGWLSMWREKYGVRPLAICGERMSADTVAAEEYKTTFRDLVSKLELSLQQIYNCDEIGLNIKCLPKRTLESTSYKAAPVFKIQKERVTVLACYNASGTNKLPLITAPRFTQPPIKLSTGSFPGVKGGQSVVPTTPPHSSAEVMESMGLYLHAPKCLHGMLLGYLYLYLESCVKHLATYKSLPSKETLRGHSDSSFRGEGYIQCCVGVRLCDMYSNQELAEIHFMYGKADGNAALARRLYQERYPQRQCPDRKTFVRLHYRLCEYGKFNSPGLGRGRPRSTTPEVQGRFWRL
ncbi:hypothetical protein ANN_24478 [Periplaneta americana]|uniref:HTH CENPB-type domain-containing protein n=1 Tax=Periplaneta americana TaxID=6978 RepID=A0ABQ8S347_PERAM|nr:hypothetical protein ANN_24478 [Periplaneta americana]